MERKVIALILSLVLVISFTPTIAAAEDTISPPQYFGVSHYMGDFYNPVCSAPEDLRTFIEKTEPKPVVGLQLDYKLGDGSWHYDSEWDTVPFQVPNQIGFSYIIADQSFITQGRQGLSSMFPEDADALKPLRESGWDFYNTALSFRARFVIPRDGNKYTFSDWSETYVYSRDVAEDVDALVNHAPKLISAKLEKNSGGMPYVTVYTDRIPGECQYLNAISYCGMSTEIWMRRAGEKDFKQINTSPFRNESVQIFVDDYFDKGKDSYAAEAYEIKIRYVLDNLNKYPQCGRSDIIYSPFSNIYSQNMPAWSNASKWASAELAKADEIGLIPSSLQGADMTKPITREEFAELAVKLYEKVTGKAAAVNSTNPFTDTKNPEILKAYQLGITQGTSATTFTPEELTNREQVATMLSRAVKVMVPGADFSTQGSPTFTDQDQISTWAVEHVKFMSKAGIIKGTDGKFMPKATTTAQQAAGYANTTREQAVAMSVRIFEQYGQ
ncbi:MAG: S-layer homology domain-containing protein [Pseudomonadota bacterium]